MNSKKRFLMQHHWPTEEVCVPGTVSPGSVIWLNVRTLYCRLHFFLNCQGKLLKGLLLRLGCIFNSKRHRINHNGVCTTGQVVKIYSKFLWKNQWA